MKCAVVLVLCIAVVIAAPGCASGAPSAQQPLSHDQQRVAKVAVQLADQGRTAVSGFAGAEVGSQVAKLARLTQISGRVPRIAEEWVSLDLPESFADAKSRWGGPGLARGWTALKALEHFGPSLGNIGAAFYRQAGTAVQAKFDQFALELFGRRFAQLDLRAKAQVYVSVFGSPDGPGLESKLTALLGEVLSATQGGNTKAKVYGSSACPRCA